MASSDHLQDFAAIKARLDEIVEAVGDDSLPLDDALDLYEEAVELGMRVSDVLEDGIEIDENELTGEAAGKSETSGEALLTIGVADVVIDHVIYAKLSDAAWYVKGYEGTDTSLVVVPEVNNLPVEEIGEEAFMNNQNLTSIDLPDTITIIRARAFKGCNNLSEMK